MSHKNGILVNDYQVTVNASGYPSQTKSNKEVGNTVNFALTRSESNELTGTISDETNTLLPENSYVVKVKIYNEDGSYIKKVTVDSDGTGQFIFQGLNPDKKYKILVLTMKNNETIEQWAKTDSTGVKSKEEAGLFTTSQSVHFRFSSLIW